MMRPIPLRWQYHDILPKKIREYLIMCPIDVEVGLEFAMMAHLDPDIALLELKMMVESHVNSNNMTGVPVMWTKPK